MRRVIAAALVVALVASPAFAEPRKILVMKSEGRADTATRTKVDTAIIKLAKTTDAQVSPGDITMSDAAAAVGCPPETPACRDEILNMLAVDEIVYASVGPKPGGTEVTAYRVARGGVSKDARSMILKGEPAEKLDGLAPLFFATTTATLPPATTTEPPTTTEPVPGQPPAPPAVPARAIEPAPLGPPYPQIIDQRSRSPLPMIGAITGGAFVLVGFLCWGKAGSLQSEIDDAPAETSADFDAIEELERQADSYAGAGNFLFLAGAVLGGVGAYFLIKNRRTQASTTAQIAPALFENGVGIVITGRTP
ncbi:MAG: hypothetical protein ACKV2T_30740 [Kofleriaceae bacterium]